PVLVAVVPVVAPVAGPLVRTVAIPVMAMAVAVVVGNDVTQHPAGGGATQRDQGIAVRQQRARHAPQASADDGVARLVVGLRGGASAQCQRAGEHNLDESFGNDHVCSPYGGPPLRCGSTCAIPRPKPEIGYLENKLAPPIRVSPA